MLKTCTAKISKKCIFFIRSQSLPNTGSLQKYTFGHTCLYTAMTFMQWIIFWFNIGIKSEQVKHLETKSYMVKFYQTYVLHATYRQIKKKSVFGLKNHFSISSISVTSSKNAEEWGVTCICSETSPKKVLWHQVMWPMNGIYTKSPLSP